MVSIIYHNAGLDGQAAAVIARNSNPGATMYGIDYGQELPPFNMGPEDTVIMVGFSVDIKIMQQIKESAQRFIWIDHKKTAIEEAAKAGFETLGCVKEGTGSCQLAWDFFNPGKPVPVGIWLLARHVVWDLQDPRVEPFQYGARTFLDSVENPMWYGVLENSETVYNTISAAGEYILKYLQSEWAKYNAGYALDVKLIGEEDEYCVRAINRGNANASIFGEIDWNCYDAVLTFALNNQGKWVCRLFSEKKDFDCSKLAQEYGGGGSKGAAGFIIDHLPFVNSNTEPQEEISGDELATKPNITEPPVQSPGLVFSEENLDVHEIDWKPCMKKAIPVEGAIINTQFWWVITREGTSLAGKAGDVLMRGVSGELYPCDREIFDKSYDWLEATQEPLPAPDDLPDAPVAPTAVEDTGTDNMAVDTPEPYIFEGMPHIGISFTLKGQDFKKDILPILKEVAKNNKGAVLVHGFMPPHEVKKRGWDNNVNDALDKLFSSSCPFWTPEGVNRRDMADALSIRGGQAFVIGRIFEGVEEELALYKEFDVPVTILGQNSKATSGGIEKAPEKKPSKPAKKKTTDKGPKPSNIAPKGVKDGTKPQPSARSKASAKKGKRK